MCSCWDFHFFRTPAITGTKQARPREGPFRLLLLDECDVGARSFAKYILRCRVGAGVARSLGDGSPGYARQQPVLRRHTLKQA